MIIILYWSNQSHKLIRFFLNILYMIHDNLHYLSLNKRMEKFIILDLIWYVIGNVPVSPYIIELRVLEFKRRIDLINFLCMTSIGLMLLNPDTSQPYVNTANTIWSNNFKDKSIGRSNLRILDSKV